MKNAQVVVCSTAALAVAFLAPPPAVAQRGGGPLLPAYLASVTMSALGSPVAADGDCWIQFVANARNNQGNPYEGASVTLEMSPYSSGVTIRNASCQPPPATTNSMGYAYLWAASTTGEYGIGFRAVATGGGRTVYSSWVAVTFSAGSWDITPSSTGSGSGSWTCDQDGGTANALFYVNGVQVTTSGDIKYFSNEDLIVQSCTAYALRTRPLPRVVKATVSGSGVNYFEYLVEWNGGLQPTYPAPPGFTFQCESSATAQGEHAGIGISQASGGVPPARGAYIEREDDASWDSCTLDDILGEPIVGGESPISPSIELRAWCSSTAEPRVVDLSASGVATGQHNIVQCRQTHEHQLNNYPAP